MEEAGHVELGLPGVLVARRRVTPQPVAARAVPAQRHRAARALRTVLHGHDEAVHQLKHKHSICCTIVLRIPFKSRYPPQSARCYLFLRHQKSAHHIKRNEVLNDDIHS